jgi:hypothetical protein
MFAGVLMAVHPSGGAFQRPPPFAGGGTPDPDATGAEGGGFRLESHRDTAAVPAAAVPLPLSVAAPATVLGHDDRCRLRWVPSRPGRYPAGDPTLLPPLATVGPLRTALVVVVPLDPVPPVVLVVGPEVVLVVDDGLPVLDVVDDGAVVVVVVVVNDGGVVMVVADPLVSGETQLAGGVDEPCWPGMTMVPAHPKSERVVSPEIVVPSEKVATDCV